MITRIAASCLLFCCALPIAFATEQATTSEAPPFESTTCGNLLDVFAAADPKLNTDEALLKSAQNRAYIFVAWTHGYLSGREGIDFSRHPSNQAGVTQIVKGLYDQCKDNDDRLLIDVVKNIR
jgi:hypothetical protein